MPRRSLGAVAALMASLAALPPAPAFGEPPPPAPTPNMLIEGKGFGHGVGMAQDGAFAMASAGASAGEILARFYPGTSIGRRSGTVEVAVLDASGPVVIALPGGGEVRDAGGGRPAGFPVTVSPGGSVQVTLAGGVYRVRPLSGASLTRPPAGATGPAAPQPPVTNRPNPAPVSVPATTPTTSLLGPLLNALTPSSVPVPTTARLAPAATAATAPSGLTEAVSAGGILAVPIGDSVVSLPAQDRRYRGSIRAAGGGGGLQLTNLVDVEQYVRGMGEVPASWPAAALQAQAIAARTVAMGAVAGGRQLCDDDRCQVYVGAGNEDPATTAAAVATRGKVLTYGGALAEAVYSASGGGVSATAEEGFGPGSPDLPYLRAASYSVADPQPWAVSVPLGQLAGRFGYRGELTAVRVTRTGPSGRPLEVTFDGGNGPMVVDGHRFSQELSLRSTLYTIRPQGSDAAPGAEPLDASVSGVRPLRTGSSGRVLVAAGLPTLGRAPWIGLATLLLAGCALLATLGPQRRERAPATPLRISDEIDGPHGN